MEDNIVYIEFFGCPGSGKSTISHQVAESLRSTSKDVNEPSYNIVHNHGRVFRIISKIISFFKLLIKNKNIFMIIIKSCRTNLGYSKKSSYYIMYNIAYKINSYLKQNHPSIQIWDEGLFQSIISICNKECEINQLKELIYNTIIKNKKIIKIYIEVDEKEAIRRMKSRQKHYSRIEKENDYNNKIIQLKNQKKMYAELCDRKTIIFESQYNRSDDLLERIKKELRDVQ